MTDCARLGGNNPPYCNQCGATHLQMCLKRPDNSYQSVQYKEMRMFYPTEGPPRLQQKIVHTNHSSYNHQVWYTSVWEEIKEFHALTNIELVAYKLLRPTEIINAEDENQVLAVREYINAQGNKERIEAMQSGSDLQKVS